jgi:hypothetical protein
MAKQKEQKPEKRKIVLHLIRLSEIYHRATLQDRENVKTFQEFLNLLNKCYEEQMAHNNGFGDYYDNDDLPVLAEDDMRRQVEGHTLAPDNNYLDDTCIELWRMETDEEFERRVLVTQKRQKAAEKAKATRKANAAKIAEERRLKKIEELNKMLKENPHLAELVKYK